MGGRTVIHFSAEYNGNYLTPDDIELLHEALKADLAELAAMDDEPDPEPEPEAEL
jgi:hypothetical protein